MNFLSHIDGVSTKSRKHVLKSFIGSLNASLIGFVRGHIRNSRYENISRSAEAPTIDAFNEALADHNEFAADAEALTSMGLRTTMAAIDVAWRLETLRVWAIGQLAEIANNPSDIPLTIANTLDFQIRRKPDINIAALKAVAQAINIDYDTLHAAKVKMFEDDTRELIDMRGQIIDTIAGLDVSDVTPDHAFDSLPAHLRYKLVAAVAVALKKAADKALTDLLRYNRIDSAGDITLIKAAHAGVLADLKALYDKESHALGEYIERGGRLLEVEPLA